MTDTYVENLIINKFLELESLEIIPKCVQYFNENKDSETPLESFIAFQPEYPDGYKKEDEPTVNTEPTKPTLPDFTKNNPDTDLPWTDEEKETAISKYKTDMETYKIEYQVYKESVEIHDSWLDERAKIEGPLVTDLIKWYRDVYPQYYNTPEGDADDDILYEAITNIIPDLTSIRKTIKLYDDDGNKSETSVYPNVAFPNSEFIRPVDENGNNTFWYELYFIPAPPNQIELGTKGRSRWVGIMQVNICIPKTWGTDELNNRYDEIAALFRSGLILEGVRITRTYRATAVDDDDFYCLPVTIEWQADLDR